MIRRLVAVGVGVAGLVAALVAQGCGSSNGANSNFVPQPPGDVDAQATDAPLFSDGALGGLQACATAEAQAQHLPVYMLMILDGSGSMADDNKWIAAVGALDAIFDELLTEQNSALGMGLTVFGDANDTTITDTTAGPYDKVDVPVGFVNQAQHLALRQRIDLTSPNLGTPTYEVMSGQFPLMETFAPQAPLASGGKRVVVLMTDGVPDPDMPAGQNEQPYTLQLVQTEFNKAPPQGPITTFVVGVGPLGPPTVPVEYDPRWLGALAIAGGAPNLPCDPNEVNNPSNMCFFQITPGGKTAAELKQEFIDTITKIRSIALGCDFKLDKSGGPIDPSQVNVVYTDGSGNQTVVPQDPSNGWTYDNPTNPSEVDLHGQACANVKADPNGKIEIVIGCKTIIK
jgi:hypothetical protein